MLEDLKDRLKKQSLAETAHISGVSVDTIRNIISGRNENPTIKTIQALVDFLDKKEAEDDIS